MKRADILATAERLVCGDREQQYSPPENSFAVIAAHWNTYLQSRGTDAPLSAVDVGLMMALFKIARIQTGSYKDDSYIDACGYLACAGEIAGGEGA